MELHNVPYKIAYRAIKYPRLEFKTGELLLILPFGRKPDILLEKHKGWILKKFDFIKGCLENSRDKELATRTDEEFRELIHSLARKITKNLRVKLNRIYFRKMRTKWASLSPAKNLTANRLMKYLPEYLIKYVIFHELTHITEKRHNGKFWEMISEEYKNYPEMEKGMFTYWFLIQRSLFHVPLVRQVQVAAALGAEHPEEMLAT